MSLLSEFKDFALKGNVMDMAIGVIIGAAFGNIVTALTDNFINPLIAVIFGGNSEDGLQIGGHETAPLIYGNKKRTPKGPFIVRIIL